MRFERDPLSVEFDPVASSLVGKAIARYRRKQKNASITAWTSGVVENRITDLTRDDGPDRLSVPERALQRSLYYDSRIYQLTSRDKPDARWSLLIDWGPVPMLPGQARSFRMQVFRDSQGARHAARIGKRERWTENPALRSNWGGPNQRFG